jgi:3-dehydroquinate synthase
MRIQHSRGSYAVEFGSFNQIAGMLPKSCFVITDRNVANHWKLDAPTLVLPAGESTKTLESHRQCLEWLADHGATRQSTLVALGGGVIGDLAGYVAASYMRGIAYISVPTTLLAQVDASIGGKVGVDLPQGKNLAGAFFPPVHIWICPDTLQTLNSREFKAGLAEVIKYSFIAAPPLLADLKHPLSPDSAMLPSLIETCIDIKAKIVEADEFELTGLRAQLNFGHTVGHALETITEYRTYLHGEAVAVGMVVEAIIGEMMGVTRKGVSEHVKAACRAQGLPDSCEDLQWIEELIECMGRDKKAKPATQVGAPPSIRMSLLVDVGKCKLVEDVPSKMVEAALKAC